MTSVDPVRALKPRPQTSLTTLQAGRAVAAILVAGFHALYVTEQELGLGEHPFGAFAAGHAGVEYFFVLSGFIMFIVHQRDLGMPGRAGSFIKKRLLRIYPIYWLILTVLLAGQIAMGRLEPFLQTPVDFVGSYLLIPRPGPEVLTAAWTLSHELLFYVLFGACLLAPRAGILLICIWFAACGLAIAVPFADDYPLKFLFKPINLLFLFGMVGAWAHSSLSASAAFVGTIIGICGMLLTAGFDLTATADISAWMTLGYGAGAVCLIAGLARLEQMGHIRSPRLLRYCGDASYSIYLAHGPALAFAAIILKKTGFASALPGWAVFIGITLTGLLAGIAVYELAERHLIKASKRLLQHDRNIRRPVSPRGTA